MVRKLAAACVLSTVALGVAACGGKSEVAPATVDGATHSGGSTSGAASAAAATGTASASQTAAGGTGAASASSVPACGNDDLEISWGYGTQSQPLQANAVVFKNISSHPCTLRGYPGATIKDAGTTIDAARVLNGFRGDLPPLSSPPLVTLSPGGSSYAVLQWLLHTDQPCYPTGTGTIEITAPNTTKTVAISTAAHMGAQGICSAFETNPVVPGTFGASAGG
ncbi:DUF4232 domain-containing protein [Actinospica sp.]|uniref:DUF4232 domain-containing protein n=1 Tax=Actinospica sp. TaxID=1872142 RepID=UPI002CA9C983|nr:DUF4232 domain-containing protein [Actinospica sp.]HWG23929.1 DUF4232 domain-containing protein [Actinospica sp.]